jgi:hypothetical protein
MPCPSFLFHISGGLSLQHHQRVIYKNTLVSRGTAWTLGCQKFRNYNHIYLVSRDGILVNGGKFAPLRSSFATIP